MLYIPWLSASRKKRRRRSSRVSCISLRPDNLGVHYSQILEAKCFLEAPDITRTAFTNFIVHSEPEDFRDERRIQVFVSKHSEQAERAWR